MALASAQSTDSRRQIQANDGTVIAVFKCGAEMEVAVEVDMSSRMTLRKAVVEILKQAASNSTVQSQISDKHVLKLK
jgi:ribosomal protein S3AE